MSIKINNTATITAIVILCLVIKTILVVTLSLDPVSDAAAYWKMATSMLHSGIMDDGQGNLAFYNSGYPLFLIPFLSFLGESYEVAQFANILLGVTSTILLYFCSKVIFKNTFLSLTTCLIWILYPPNILYTEYLAKENLMIPLLLAQTLLMITHKGNMLNTILMGATFALGMLTGSAIILTVLPMLYVISNFKYKKITNQKINKSGITVFFLTFILVLSPWLAYTKHHIGKAVITTNGGFNLYLGNNENSTYHFISIMDTPIGKDWHNLRAKEGEVDSFSHLKKLAINYILNNPIRTIKSSIEKVILFWTPPYHDGKGASLSGEKIVRIIWLLAYLTIMFFGLISLLKINKFKREHYLILSTILLYCLIYGATYVGHRYRLPIMPLVIILTVYGLNDFISNKLSAKENKI